MKVLWLPHRISTSIIINALLTAARLAQLGERRSAEREFASSNPGRTNTQGLKNNWGETEQALSPEVRVLRFRVECISVSKKQKILGSFPIRGCFLFTCRSLRFSFVFDNLFCGYEVRHKQNFRLRNLGNETPVEVLRISSDGDEKRICWV